MRHEDEVNTRRSKTNVRRIRPGIILCFLSFDVDCSTAEHIMQRLFTEYGGGICKISSCLAKASSGV